MVIFRVQEHIFYDPPCGFYVTTILDQLSIWRQSEETTSFVRYVYDEDGDGFPVGLDFDDVDEDITDDEDGDGYPWYIDCDDTNPDIGLDCDEDGFLPEEDCDDNDPLLGGDFEDCDGDGILIDEDCDDGDYSIGFGERTGHLEDCAGTDCLSILENGFSLGWIVLDSTL